MNQSAFARYVPRTKPLLVARRFIMLEEALGRIVHVSHVRRAIAQAAGRGAP